MIGVVRYAARRLLFIIPLLIGISILNFTMMRLAGDPVALIIANNPDTSARLLEEMRAYFGLDKPLHIQYFLWLWNLLHLDLGHSIVLGYSVNQLIGWWSWQTLKIQLVSISVALAIAIIVGTKAANKQFSWVDSFAQLMGAFGISIPVFLTGVWSIIIFSFYLGWLPSYGAFSTGEPIGGSLIFDELAHMVLPCSTLIIYLSAIFVRLVRSSMLEVLRQDFILAARASGLSERAILYKHALGNALMPITTYVGIYVGLSIAGAPIIETVFSWPGLGYLYIQSIIRLDFPVLMGLTMLISAMALGVNLITDIIYGIIDPRIRLE